MRKMIFLCGLTLLFLVLRASGQSTPGDNTLLQQMADQDQQERLGNAVDWKELDKRDSARRLKVFELIRLNEVITPKDHFNAGIILQHGKDTVASAMAVYNFAIAIEHDTTLNRWWYAAAVDRDRMRRNQPQIYGTQFLQDARTGKWTRYNIDSTQVSDEKRRYYSVETLAEQAEKERLMNQVPLSDYYKANKSLEQTLQQIKQDFEKGRLAAQSLEAEINQFGNELSAGGKQKEALAVFRLNTELYPDSFTTFDSYGASLIRAGKKKAGLKAYRRSLKLNPANEHARNVLRSAKQRK